MDNAYFTPSAFFGGITASSAADTADDGTVCALDGEGVARSVVASGHRILFPDIGGGVGSVRQRYPIFPISDDGLPAFKEVKALEDVFLSDDYDDADDGEDVFGQNRDLVYGFTLHLQGGGHQHELYVAGWRVREHWYSDDDGQFVNDSTITIEVDTEERDGHSHTLDVARWRSHDDSEWVYVIDRCRFGSISDGDQFGDDDYLDGECADLHDAIIRD